jgi:hypothetical protein
MSERFAIYFAPARDSRLWQHAQAWLAQPAMATRTVSVRRYGFHATIKAPMGLRSGADLGSLRAGLDAFCARHAPVVLSRLAPRLIDGFLALTTEPQPPRVTELAEAVTVAFEPFRAPLTEAEMARRLAAPLTARQVVLLEHYGYPYVLEQFQFHMTLTDRLPSEDRDAMLDSATAWFAEALTAPVMLDRLVLFHEPEPGATFVRLEPDYRLMGMT